MKILELIKSKLCLYYYGYYNFVGDKEKIVSFISENYTKEEIERYEKIYLDPRKLAISPSILGLQTDEIKAFLRDVKVPFLIQDGGDWVLSAWDDCTNYDFEYKLTTK